MQEIDDRRVVAALRAVRGISTEALERDVIADLCRACERFSLAIQDIGMTGDRGLDQAAEAAYLTLLKIKGEGDV